MIYVGIDPGLGGGVAALHNNVVGELHALPMPILNRAIDTTALTLYLKKLRASDDVVAAIERQGYRPKQAGVETLLTNYGRLLAALELAFIPYEVVTAPVWNRQAGIKTGLTGAAKKAEAFRVACQHFGTDRLMDLGLRARNDGQIEALLIARWRMYMG